jgi:uncharacterized protein (DUF2267 family)
MFPGRMILISRFDKERCGLFRGIGIHFSSIQFGPVIWMRTNPSPGRVDSHDFDNNKLQIMAVNINKYTAEANRFINEVAAELGDSSAWDMAGRVTIAVFHTLREKLTPEESFHLISQLPMILKGIYVDGWDPAKQVERTDTLEEFLQHLRDHDARAAGRDFGDDEQAARHFQAVLRVMSHYISDGEMKHIRQQLPRPVAQLFETW